MEWLSGQDCYDDQMWLASSDKPTQICKWKGMASYPIHHLPLDLQSLRWLLLRERHNDRGKKCMGTKKYTCRASCKVFVLVLHMPIYRRNFLLLLLVKYKFYIKSGSYSEVNICLLCFPLLWVLVCTLVEPAKRAKNTFVCPFGTNTSLFQSVWSSWIKMSIATKWAKFFST